MQTTGAAAADGAYGAAWSKASSSKAGGAKKFLAPAAPVQTAVRRGGI
jgi:hypothetical protein